LLQASYTIEQKGLMMGYTPFERRVMAGWETFQNNLIEIVKPLTEEQLQLRAAPKQRSLGEIGQHVVAVRARWFCIDLGECAEGMVPLQKWDGKGQPQRTGDEIAQGLAATWEHMQTAMARWTPEQWQEQVANTLDDDVSERAWVVWHLLEHDLAHGGEFFLTCGLHGLPTPDW
jgi:uncharacterized damage-inducible protein DinB